jgi:hypothetical protein
MQGTLYRISAHGLAEFVCRPLISKHVSSSAEEEIVVVSVLSGEEQKQKRKRRRFWVHNMCKTRMIHGEFHSLYPDLQEDEAKFFEYFRMTYGEVMTLLNKLGPNLSRGKYIF